MNAPVINVSPDSPYVVYNSPTAAHVAANVVGYNFVFNSTAGNAALLPEMADQFDLSFERYFGSSSAFTFDLFFKKLSNSLSYDNFGRTFTNNGATETAQIRGPVNEKDGGRIKGFEIAYQTFFDFLPGLWSGLGLQANYTYVDPTGINNSNLIDATSTGGVGAVGAGVPVVTGVVIDSHKLEGVSNHTFNLVGLYEKGPIGIRLAYNWRSQYLTSNLDCCIGFAGIPEGCGVPRRLDTLLDRHPRRVVVRCGQPAGHQDRVRAANIWRFLGNPGSQARVYGFGLVSGRSALPTRHPRQVLIFARLAVPPISDFKEFRKSTGGFLLLESRSYGMAQNEPRRTIKGRP